MPVLAYNTSDLYKEAIDKESRVTFIDGELITTKGTTIAINNKAIDSGSFYITNQCVSNDAFAYGSVFAAEAGITLKTDIDRYSLYDSEIKLFFNLLLSNNEYERIPLGKFYVNEPSRVGKNITIKAYDGMINLEKDLEENTTGTAYELLLFVGDRCGVEIAQTEEEIAAFVNSDVLLSVVIDRIDTYRDLVAYIAQVTCTFAIFDREGKLRLCEYGTTPAKTIQARARTASKFSDFESFFSTAKASFVSDAVYKGYVYDDIERTDGLLYDAGEVPIIQGLDETNQAVIDNMYTKLANVRYVPCEVTFNGDPSLDLGDMIVNVDRFGNQITSLITYYKWSYRGGHQLKSAGSNPKLASVKEKKNKDLANMQAEINAKTVAVYSYTNAKAFSVKGGENVKDMDEIICIAFAVNENVTALFMATIQFDMDYDGFVELNSYLDSVFYENSTVCQYCHAGPNIITIMNYISCEQNKTYKFSVMAKTYYEETDLRVNTAKIATNENAKEATIVAYESLVAALKTATEVPITELDDTITYDVVKPITNVPKMSIDKFAIKAAIFGQGLAGEVAWDGTLTFEEQFGELEIETFSVDDFKPEIAFKHITPTPAGITAAFGIMQIDDVVIEGFDSAVSVDEIIVNYIFETAKKSHYSMTSKVDTNDGSFKVMSNNVYESTEIEIDKGHACSVLIDMSEIKDVQSIEVEEK